MSDASRMVLYLGLILLLTVAGGGAPLLRAWSRDRLALLLSFGGGVLLGAAFLRMLPSTVEALGVWVGAPFLGGFVVLFILQKFILLHPCGEEDCEVHAIGIPAFGGITFHALLDGVAMGASFMVPRLAGAVFAAIAVHKMPAAASLSSLLLLARYPRRKVFLYVVLFSLATPLGAVLSYLFLQNLGPRELAVAVGVSAGSFLALATSDILPQIHQVERFRAGTLLLFLAGIALMAASGLIPEP